MVSHWNLKTEKNTDELLARRSISEGRATAYRVAV
jgi:hypothetical protein